MTLQIFDSPDRFVAGTVGPPGQRVFFLQVRQDRRLVSFSLEKQQVSALADQLLTSVEALAPVSGSDDAAIALDDNDPLETPIEDEFRAQSLRMYWLPPQERLVVEATAEDFPDTDDGVSDDEDAALEAMTDPVVRVVLTPAQARAFVRRSRRLLSAGRRPCPFCGLPLDPAGHVCPRANGYRR